MIVESPRSPADARRRDTVDAGRYWIARVEAGETLRIVDTHGNQAADTLFYDAADPSERYSAVDTIREQGNVYLTAGSVLMSTACRPLLEIVADTCGRHDTLGGACSTESNTVRYALDASVTCTPAATAGCWPSPSTPNTASRNATSPTTSTSS